MHAPRRVSLFVLAMMNTSIVVGLEGLPEVGSFGLSLVVWYALFTVLFFLPVGLVSAELGVGWPHEGGVYLWVKEGLGPRSALLAIWCQWLQILVWYPTVLAVCAVSAAWAISPGGETSPWLVLTISLAVFWFATLANFKGLHTSGTITTWFLYLGTILPVLAAIALAGWWLLSGRPSAIPLNAGDMVPDVSSLAGFVGILAIFSFLSGLEVNAVHFNRVRNPQRSIPGALLLSGLLVLVISVLGGLSVAVMVPVKDINFASGTLQVFHHVLNPLGVGWLVQVIAVLALLGMIGHIMVWVIGPTESIRVAARDGLVPPLLQRTTAGGAPRNVMLLQACIVSLICLLMLVLDMNAVFYVLTIVSGQIYLVMYTLMFLAVIALRIKRPEVERSFKIPGGLPGLCLVAGVGALTCIGGLALMFIPPAMESVHLSSSWFTPVVGVVFLSVILTPFLLHRLRKGSWAASADPNKSTGIWERGD
ncbi:MAG: APC family permease [Phycisphaerales bacterium]|nr:APC family permease [Phycisphaerales bacterium]